MLQAYGAQRLRFSYRIYLAWVANGAILPSNVLGLDWIEQSSIWDRSGTRCFHTWLVGRWSQGLGDRKALQLFLNICKVKGQGLKRCKFIWAKIWINELPVIGAVLHGEICTVQFLAFVFLTVLLDGFMQVAESSD